MTRPPRPGRSRSRSPTRGAGCTTSASRARRPSCSSASPRGCCTPTDRCGRRPEVLARSTLGQEGLWGHGVSGDVPILLVRVVSDANLPLVRQVLQAQEYWRLKGLSADVVILNEHPVSYLDEVHAQLAALLDDGPWRTWQHKRGGAYLLRGDRMVRGRAPPPPPERGARRPRSATAGRSPSSSIERGFAAGADASRRPSLAPESRRRAPPDRGAGGAAARARERDRRLRRRRARVRRRPRGRRGDAAARGRTSSRAPPSGPSSRRRDRPSPGPRTAARTGSRRSRTTRSAIRPRRPSSSATTTAARRGRPPRGLCPAPRTSGRFVIRHGAGVTRFARATNGIRHALDVFVDAVDPGEALAAEPDERDRRAAAPLRLRVHRSGRWARRGRATTTTW